MTATIIDGKAIAQETRAKIATAAAALTKEHGIVPGLAVVLVGSDPVKKAIQEHARVAELLAIALDEGMHTLKQDGMEKVLQGITDMHQVRAVCIK